MFALSEHSLNVNSDAHANEGAISICIYIPRTSIFLYKLYKHAAVAEALLQRYFASFLETGLPAALIGTSPANYQAWIKLSDSPISAELRKAVAQEFVRQYGGDPANADAQHYGRLAGLPTKSLNTQETGDSLMCWPMRAIGWMAARAAQILQRVQGMLAEAPAKTEKKRRLKALQTARPDSYGARHNPIQEYQRQAQRLMQRHGPDADFSRLDWMIAKDMAQPGRFTVQGIEGGIRVLAAYRSLQGGPPRGLRPPHGGQGPTGVPAGSASDARSGQGIEP